MRRAAYAGTFAAVLLLAFTALPARAADPFEGKWKVTLTSEGANGKDLTDTLVFTRGDKFSAVEMKKRGFPEVTYESDTRRFGPATFKAEQTSPKEGKAKWEGTVAAVEISGTMVLTKKDGSTINYTFKGSKVQ